MFIINYFNIFVHINQNENKLKTQFLVTNRITRNSQILNPLELNTFLKNKNQNDYAIDTIKSKKESILDILFLSWIYRRLLICITKLIMLWI